MKNRSLPSTRQSHLPERVQAAFEVLRHYEIVQQGRVVPGPQGPVLLPGREPDNLEKGARNAALNLLRNWLNGENGIEVGEQGGFLGQANQGEAA